MTLLLVMMLILLRLSTALQCHQKIFDINTLLMPLPKNNNGRVRNLMDIYSIGIRQIVPANRLVRFLYRYAVKNPPLYSGYNHTMIKMGRSVFGLSLRMNSELCHPSIYAIYAG